MKVRSLPALAVLWALVVGCGGSKTSPSSSASTTQGTTSRSSQQAGSSQRAAVKPQDLILGKWRFEVPDEVVGQTFRGSGKDSTHDIIETSLRKGYVGIFEFDKDGYAVEYSQSGMEQHKLKYRFVDDRTLVFAHPKNTSKMMIATIEELTQEKLVYRFDKLKKVTFTRAR